MAPRWRGFALAGADLQSVLFCDIWHGLQILASEGQRGAIKYLNTFDLAGLFLFFESRK